MLGTDKETSLLGMTFFFFSFFLSFSLVESTEQAYKELSMKCVEAQISFNAIAFPQKNYMDLASICMLHYISLLLPLLSLLISHPFALITSITHFYFHSLTHSLLHTHTHTHTQPLSASSVVG